jgi:hypothetical protein
MNSKIDEINVKYNSWNDNYYISINKDNKEIWYTYEILCSYSIENKKVLWAKNMIIISKKVKSKLIKEIKDDKISEGDLENFLIKNKSNYINIISNRYNESKIYLGLKEIIKN